MRLGPARPVVEGDQGVLGSDQPVGVEEEADIESVEVDLVEGRRRLARQHLRPLARCQAQPTAAAPLGAVIGAAAAWLPASRGRPGSEQNLA